MAYDPGADQLYVTPVTSGELFRVDPYSGVTTVVGVMPEWVWGLGFDGSTGSLFGWTTFSNVPVRIDTQDASFTVIGEGSVTANVEGLTFDPASQLLYAVLLRSPIEDSMLATLDPDTAELTEIGALGTDDFISGLAMTPEPSTLLLLLAGLAGATRHRAG